MPTSQLCLSAERMRESKAEEGQTGRAQERIQSSGEERKKEDIKSHHVNPLTSLAENLPIRRETVCVCKHATER